MVESFGNGERDMAVSGLINRGAEAYRGGQRAEARSLFAEALIAEPENEVAWLWFATVATERGQQRYCIDRALQINPESAGRVRLRRLERAQPVVPPELAELEPPVLPPDLQAAPVGLANRLPLRPIRRRVKTTEPDALADPVAQPIPAMTVVEAVPEPVAEPEEIKPRVTVISDGAADEATPRWRQPWLLAAAAAVLIVGLALLLRDDEADPYTIALVAPVTGAVDYIGEEQVRAAELAVDEINDEGGIDGHPVELTVYVDENNADVARQRAEQVAADDDVLLVIGHYGNDASIAAGEVYGAAGLPIVSAAAAADAVTADKPWSFSVVVPASTQGAFAARYVRDVLRYDHVSIVGSSGPFATAVQAAFGGETRAEGGTVEHTWTLDEANVEASIQSVVGELAADADPGMVLLSLPIPEARAFLLASRRAGVAPAMLGVQTIGFGDFADLFEVEPEEQDDPGFFTDGLIVASPLVYDSLGGEAAQFADRYRARYDTSPEWFGAKVYDAVTVAARALALAAPTDGDTAARRQAVRAALLGMDAPANGAAGLAGPLFFPEGNDVPQAMQMGRFVGGRLTSEPTQFRVVLQPEQFDLEADRAAGRLMEVGPRMFRSYRVVYVGLDLNEVSELDTRSQTFNADFFLWFR